MSKAGLSVVVPVYNSAESLPELVHRLNEVLAGLTDQYELILVDDGSRDQSWAVVQSLSHTHAQVRGIQLMRNYGQHNALLCGIRAAQYEVIATIDDDLQNPPEEIPKLLDALNEHTDVVYGSPCQEQHGAMRNLASVVTKLVLQAIMGAQTARSVSSFRVFRTCVRDAFQQYHGSFVSVDVLLTWGTSRFSSVRVRHEDRKSGRSSYSFRKLLTHAINMMTGFSALPLQMASWIGFLFTLFGIAVLAYVVGRYLMFGSSVQGFPFLASVLAIFSGAQLFALGIIGEYLARMHYRIMDRPGYSVRTATAEE